MRPPSGCSLTICRICSRGSPLARWIEAIKKDIREIFRACADAEKIKDYIPGFLPKKEERAA